MTRLDDLTRELQDNRNGVRSSLNYSIDNVAGICDETGRSLVQVEEELDLAQTEISELIRSLDKIRKSCAGTRKDLLEAGERGDEQDQRKALEKLERLMVLKGQFEEREAALRNRKDDLQNSRRALLAVLQRAEEDLNRFRLSKELLCSGASDLEHVDDMRELRLAALTLQFAEQERLRLARELHDGPAQLFAAGILLMELVEKLLAMGDMERAGYEVTRVKEQMKDSLGDIRAFLWNLKPQELDEGLRRGLEKLAEQTSSRGLSSVAVDFHGSDARLTPVHGTNVFRIVQEALNNAVKNGHAPNVRISVHVDNVEIRGRIEDDGCGFEVESAKRRSREKGSFGLANMEERARLLGGNCTLNSIPGEGSTVSFRVPIGGGGVHLEEG